MHDKPPGVTFLRRGCDNVMKYAIIPLQFHDCALEFLMDERTLRVLDYPAVKEMLAARASSSLGRRKAVSAYPSTEIKRINSWLDETTEAVKLISELGSFPFGGLSDIDELIRKARVASLLEGQALLKIAGCLRAAVSVRTHVEKLADELPRLWKLAGDLSDEMQLARRIDQALEDDGGVRPDASPALIRLHRRAIALEDTMRQRMNSILREAVDRGLLQDAVIVSRDNRFCLPIKAAVQSRFNGIIHDRSATGATVFMEPVEIVQRGNELREVFLSIRDEEEAVLRELTDDVAAIADALDTDQTILSVLDYISAKARLAIDLRATPPIMRDDGVTSLRSARHPLIPDDVIVPVTIWIGEDYNTLVITGPNTGGKTVSLKTLGLCTVMAMSGLHIPAESGSEISIFENVWADIGDEQSIEQSLSTFSSHMTQIVKIVNRIHAAQRRHSRDGKSIDTSARAHRISALVLLDEVGAGTDPTEGAALAKTILAFLHSAGCRTVATTHYNALKLHAYSEPGFQNAAVQFDVRTLKPTYRLLIGHPGSSNAFEISQRLGLPREIVRQARDTLDEEQLNIEQAIAQMRDSKDRYDREAREIKKDGHEVERLRQEYDEKLRKVEERESRARKDACNEALQIVREAEDQAREIIARLQAQPKQGKATQQARDELADLRKASATKAKKAEREHRAFEQPQEEVEDEEGVRSLDLEIGAWVHVATFSQDGTIAREIGPATYEVSIGNMRVQVDIEDLLPPKNPPAPESIALAKRLKATKSQTIKSEINLIGKMVAEALFELEKYLDDAALAQLSEVRIVHGKGTGALRDAVWKYLKRNPHIRDFETAAVSDGGTGATVAYLR